jgi:hypothetical protein
MTPADYNTLRFLAANPTGGYRHVADWPPGTHAAIAEMVKAGLVEQRPPPKANPRGARCWFRITDAGRVAIAEAVVP